jgi:hypothetical protein
VLLDGRRANSCLALAVAHQRSEVTTVEGLVSGGELHALQRLFIERVDIQPFFTSRSLDAATSRPLLASVGSKVRPHAQWEQAAPAAADGAARSGERLEPLLDR